MTNTTELTEAECGYIAGLIDGEGYIFIRFNPGDLSYPKGHRKRWRTWHLGVTVSNTNAPVIEWVHEKFGGNLFRGPAPKPHQKPINCWTTTGRNVVPALSAALPHMIIKKRQAEIALAFAATMRGTGRAGHTPEVTASREEWHREISALNRRGVPLDLAA